MNIKESTIKQEKNLSKIGAKSTISLDFFDFSEWLKSYCQLKNISENIEDLADSPFSVKIMSEKDMGDREDIERTFYNMKETETLNIEDLDEIVSYLILFGELPFGHYQFSFNC